MVAPTNLFCFIHNMHSTPAGVKKIVMIPTTSDRTTNSSCSIIGSSSSLNDTLNRGHLNLVDVKRAVRVPLVKYAFQNLLSNASNAYTVGGKRSGVEKSRHFDEIFDSVNAEEIDEQPQENPTVHLDCDPVEGNRNTLPFIGSVFLPNGAHNPGSDGCPINFLEVKHPYVTALPTFFPHGLGGLHTNREIDVTETEFVLHFMRNVRKELVECPLFVLQAAYRLETHRLRSCHNALRGYITPEDTTPQAVKDLRLHFMHLTGSNDYYTKQRLDLIAKSDAFGFPQLFYTFTSTDRWNTTLSSCLMQDGHDVWHVDDEEKLGVLPGRESLTDVDMEEEYAVHSPSPGSSNCPFHLNCFRSYVSDFLTMEQKKELLNRNLYTVNRIFDKRSRDVVKNILTSSENPMGAAAYHDIKEFGNVSGWAHLHGVAWRRLDGTTEDIFRKLQSCKMVTEDEKTIIEDLAKSIVCVSLSADRIGTLFPDLSGQRAEAIAVLAAKYQCHGCTQKCQSNKKEYCWYNYPQEPSLKALIAAPPSKDTIGVEVARNLVIQSSAIKEAVKETIRDISNNDGLSTTNLQSIVLQAIGDIVELEENNGFSWKGGIFPQIPTGGRQSVDSWRRRLQGYLRPEEQIALAIYHASLATSSDENYHFVCKRDVTEAWVVSYNPYCLEVMKSNMAMELILYTPRRVIDYITKGNKDKMGEEGNESKSRVVQLLDEIGPRNQKAVRDRAKKMMEVCMSEAIFRIDKQLRISDSNVHVVWVNSSFPGLRGSTYAYTDEEGLELPNRQREVVRKSRIEDCYQKK